MNYYEHHLGDWAASTAHLSWDEDMAYSRLLRAYYQAEQPIREGQQYRLARASTPAQRKAVDAVLAEFFTLTEDCWHQKRAEEEIARYQDKQRKAKASANARWSQSERNAKAMRTHSEGNAPRHQTPDTNTKEQAHAAIPQPQARAPDPETEGHKPTPAGLVCRSLKAQGMAAVNPGDPRLTALVEQGATLAEFEGIGAEAVAKGKGFAWVLAVLTARRAEAAAMTLAPPVPDSAAPSVSPQVEATRRMLADRKPLTPAEIEANREAVGKIRERLKGITQ